MPSEKSDLPNQPSSSESAGTPSSLPDTGNIEEEVRSAATEYFENLTEAAGRLTQQAREMYKTSHSYAGDHPASFVAGAFGVGILLGFLLGRD